MKKKILISCKLPGLFFEKFLQSDDFIIKVLNDDERKIFSESVNNFKPDGIISLLSDKISADVMDLSPNLKVISNYAVGYNNIDISAAKERGIVVTNTPGVLTDATADIAFLLILMVTRRALEAEEFTRQRLFTGWMPELFLGKSLQGKTLGIIGMGRIGKAVAKRALAFGMKIIYNKNNRLSLEEESSIQAEFKSKEELIKTSDVISLHLPYTKEVHHLIGKKELEMMKKSAVLINTARGPLVDEDALAEALKNKTIFGAGFDVYEFEPQINEKLFALKNAVLLPHIGSATEETRAEMAEMVVKDCTAVLSGNNALNVVE